MTLALGKRFGDVAVVAGMIAAACALGLVLASADGFRLGLAIGVAAIGAAIGITRPQALLYCLPVWLVALGTTRRLTTGLVNSSASTDVLLIVGPASLSLLGAQAVRAGALRYRTPLTTAVVGLIALLALSAFNPDQGGLTVGLAGATIVVSPMLAFFVGRSITDDRTLSRLLALIALLAIPASLYGLFQTFIGFPAWDQEWIEALGYTALNVGEAIRPFGPFASGQEFGAYAGVGLVIVLAHSQLLRRAWFVPVLAIFAAAVWFESARGGLVLTIAAAAIVLCARAGLSAGRALVLALMLVSSLPWVSARVAPGSFGDDSRSHLATHQVEGLTDPFGSNSTLPGHIERVVDGLRSALSDPLGSGVGAVTTAASKFGGAQAGTEVDISNVAVAAGLPGLAAFVVITWLGISRAYEVARSGRAPLPLGAIGILIVTSLQWLNGGLYSVMWLPWLVLGWVDRPPPVADRAPAVDAETTAVARGGAPWR